MNKELLRTMNNMRVQGKLLVDMPCKVSTETMLDMIDATGHYDYKQIIQMLSPNTTNFTGALYYARRDAWYRFSHALIIVNDKRSYENLLAPYHEKKQDITVMFAVVADSGRWIMCSEEEYLSLYSADEFRLDYYMSQYNNSDEQLSSIADIYTQAIGWRLSASPYSLDAGVDLLPKMRRGTKSLPYAGKDMYEIVQAKEYTLIDIEAPGPLSTVYPTRKSILLAGKGAPTSELQEILEGAIFYQEHPELLDEGWIMCECGYPVFTLGNDPEDGYCQFCDRPIPGFELSTVRYQDFLEYTEEEDSVKKSSGKSWSLWKSERTSELTPAEMQKLYDYWMSK